MRAVILAGGEGTRLRPLSLHRPKPMVQLFNRPVMEYTLAHLKSHGITEMVTALQTLPHVVTDYFGDGSRFGVSLTHCTEQTPLGTAGAVRACARKFAGGREPLLIMSGDGICDLDLTAAAEFHRNSKSKATVVLRRQNNLMGYGLVMTDALGRVERFIEKPSWGQVFCDTVNTGIYILEPEVIDMIPADTFYDFAKDLFPRLLADGVPMFGCVREGYWCDIGDTDSYLQCAFDMLDLKLKFPPPAAKAAAGVWSDSPIPAGTVITAPCWISRGVTIGAGAKIGPYAVIGADCSVADGATVERSVLDGAAVGEHADIEGSVVCRGVTVGRGARLHEGTVLGEGVCVGDHAVVWENSRVWPGKEIEDGASVRGSLAGSAARRVLFDGEGALSGQPNVDLTPDMLLRLGAACAAAVREGGEIALSWQGGDAARLMAGALETGITAAGGNAVYHDAAFAAQAAFAAGNYRFALSVFVLQYGSTVKCCFYGSDGLPPERSLELKLESLATRGEITFREARAVGSVRKITGVGALYEIAAAEPPEWYSFARPFSAAVRGGGAAAQALYNVLKICRATAKSDTRLPVFELEPDGFTLSATDELDRFVPYERLIAILAAQEAARGNSALSAPYSAPMFLDNLENVRIMRPGRDAGARELLSAQGYMRDGVFLAARLSHILMSGEHTLAQLNDALPPFHISSMELPLEHDRGAVMRGLADGFDPDERELFEGLRAKTDGGWVHVTPMPGRRALRISGEGASEEIAAELCFRARRRAIETDRKLTINN